MSILSLSEFEKIDAKKIYMLGMSDQAMEASSFLPVTEQDLKKLEQDIGFILDSKALDQEFKASWIMSSKAEIIIGFGGAGIFFRRA